MLNLLSPNAMLELSIAGLGAILVISAFWFPIVGIVTGNPSNKWVLIVPVTLFIVWVMFMGAVGTYEYELINYLAGELYWYLVVIGW